MARLELSRGTYDAADALLRGKSSRKVGHNTVLHRAYPDRIAVRYHATDVYTMTADGWAILNTGGWDTVTTAQRINALLPGPWRVSFSRGLYFGGRLITPYADGLAVKVSGEGEGSVGYAERSGHPGALLAPGVLLAPDDVAAIVKAADDAAAERAARAVARMAEQHPAPRHLFVGLGNVNCDAPDCNGAHFTLPSGALLREVDMSHGHRRQFRPNGPHGGRGYHPGYRDECGNCRAEDDGAAVIRRAALAAEHDAGHSEERRNGSGSGTYTETFPAHDPTNWWGVGAECPTCRAYRASR